MIFLTIATHSILGLTYLGLGIGYIPGLQMNRATIVLVGSSFLIALGVIDLQAAWQVIDITTIVFLLSMMVVNANREQWEILPTCIIGIIGLYPQPIWFVDSFNSW